MFMYTCIWRGCIGWWEQCNLCKIKIINSASFWCLFNIPWMWLWHHCPGWETYEKHYFKQTTVKMLGCVCEVSEVFLRRVEGWQKRHFRQRYYVKWKGQVHTRILRAMWSSGILKTWIMIISCLFCSYVPPCDPLSLSTSCLPVFSPCIPISILTYYYFRKKRFSMSR